MNYKFQLDLDAIAQTATKLEQALFKIKQRYHEQGNADYEPIADWLIDRLSPIITICKNKEIDQPFNIATFAVSRAGRDAVDLLFDPRHEADSLFDNLYKLLKGGMERDDFINSSYADEYPAKMIPLLEAQAEEDRRKRELKKQQNL